MAGLPMIRVTCAGDGCRYEGQKRDVPLQPAGIGLVAVPDLRCAGCGTVPETVSVWPSTPEQENDDMPKITVHGGATIAADETGQEEQSSPGTSSSTSSETEQTSPDKSEKPTRRRARTTGNRSAKAQTGASTAPGTDGGQATGTSDKTSDDRES